MTPSEFLSSVPLTDAIILVVSVAVIAVILLLTFGADPK